VNADPFLLTIRTILEAARVPYMVTGSFASSLHGTARSTHDLDVVIDPSREALLELLDSLPPAKYYFNRDTALAALADRTQFNVVDCTTGWKVDFILVKPRAFSREEFGRRRPVEISGVRLDIATAEDSILSKLEWAKLTESARQIEDAAGVIRMQREALDIPYVEGWVRNLGLDAEWLKAKARAGETQAT
jgi:hypothetical protein